MQAVIAGQGVGICSDILVRHELASGQLVRVSDAPLDGHGFFFVHRRGDSRKAVERSFDDEAARLHPKDQEP